MTQTNWKELQELANKADYTKPPVRRPQPQTRVAPVMTEDQTALGIRNKYTPDAHATAFAWENRNNLRYVPQSSKWVYWDGYVWKWDEDGRADELVKTYGRKFLYTASADEDTKKADLAAHRYITSAKGISEILKLSATDRMMAANIKDFDADIYGLNTPDGVVDLYTGECTAPNPSTLVKRSTRVAPDKNCPTPLYDTLLSQAFAGEPDLSKYFEQMMGVSLVMAQDEQVFMYLYGVAGSGKGTLMNIAMDILGKGDTGYTSYIESSMFVQSRNQGHPTEMMQFLGARMVVSSEVTQGARMDTGKLKKVTGGDPITGRFMNKDFVTFDATHTLWIMANDRLQVPHDDKGVWRRLRVIDFKHAKKAEEMVGGLPALIVQQEGPGILARWIEKATQYLKEGFEVPDSVRAAGETYVTEQDTVKEWIEYNGDTDDVSIFSTSKALREDYVQWCRQERKTPVDARKFAASLVAQGFESTKAYVPSFDGTRSQLRGYRGLTLA